MTQLLIGEETTVQSAGITSAAPMLSVNAITKAFPRRKSWSEILRSPFSHEAIPTLQSVSFDVAPGEFFGLLGQNGAGKTTLFRVLSTLVLPDSGDATIGGFSVRTQAARVRAIAAPVIANERSLNWRLTARENLRLFAALQGIRGAHVQREVERVLQVVQLSDTDNKLVGAFSSGMRQRVLIARALLGRPRVLLLDEPTRSLDPISARDFRTFLRDVIVGEHGCTVLLATHDADDVWNLCDRVGVLHKGHLLAVERTSVLRQRAGGDLHRIWMRGVADSLRDYLSRVNGVTLIGEGRPVEMGWTEFTFELRGGTARAAALLSDLNDDGIGVARFEKNAPDLATMIDRVIQNRGAIST